jgi:alpha-mannosidase
VSYELRAHDPRVYLRWEADWFERGSPTIGVPALRLVLPTTLTGAEATYEIPFGKITRDLIRGEEVPGLEWAAVVGADADSKRGGIVLANDGKYGYSLRAPQATGAALTLTLLRSAYDPDPLPEIGHHELRLTLQPFAGAVSTADAVNTARRLTHPLRAVAVPQLAAGAASANELLPATGASLVTLTNDELIFVAMKRAEDSAAFLLRIYNASGAAQTGAVQFAAAVGAVKSAAEVDLIEREITPIAATAHEVKIIVPPHGLTTVKVVFANQ